MVPLTLFTTRLVSQQPVIWYIVFKDRAKESPAPGFIVRWLKPGFNHLFAFRAADTAGTVVIEGLSQGIHLSHFDMSPESCANACKAAGNRVLIYSANPMVRFNYKGLITCVSIIKSMIYLKGWQVVTPYQLYKLLLRSGAREV